AEGGVGWGESFAPELPWYSGETPKTVWYLLDEIVIPALMAAELHQPEDTERIVAWIREHRMAKATLEMAIWDLFAKRDGRSLSKLLEEVPDRQDRKSTRLNSSHEWISYAVFCLKKKKANTAVQR